MIGKVKLLFVLIYNSLLSLINGFFSGNLINVHVCTNNHINSIYFRYMIFYYLPFGRYFLSKYRSLVQFTFLHDNAGYRSKIIVDLNRSCHTLDKFNFKFDNMIPRKRKNIIIEFKLLDDKKNKVMDLDRFEKIYKPINENTFKNILIFNGVNPKDDCFVLITFFDFDRCDEVVRLIELKNCKDRYLCDIFDENITSY